MTLAMTGTTASVSSGSTRLPRAWPPRLLKAAGAYPLEDVGGVWGYEKSLEVLADPA